MTSLSRKLKVVMHRRDDGSNYDVSGLTEIMFFGTWQNSVPKGFPLHEVILPLKQ